MFDIHPQYTVALLSIAKTVKHDKSGISLKGPFTSMKSFLNGKDIKPHRFPISDVLNWNESVSLPLLPTPYSAEVFGQLRKSPWLFQTRKSEWRARPDGELHATAQRSLMDLFRRMP